MSRPAAKLGDQILATDIHVIMNPSPGGPVPTPTPHPFAGVIDSNVSTNVVIMGKPAAMLGSSSTNTPPHLPIGAGPFMKPPTNRGTIVSGSATVLINGKPAARAGDQAMTCNDPVDLPVGTVSAVGTVLIGG
jgi:uncharacterized Zn-binding protein involved in type VI secretion